ncbi:hypothetical protein E3Q23_04278 [Wallemia mellicola]|uniref:Zn(2)-C6 fungal-type domain-containing protein n=1 Tax=Wallemia mellicola TaxID=1708541 RepID=A0AB38MP83_9BASI|nr:hypothetical protein E3Q23_04278 [Wallemia mellicola]TIB78651.1 hypothetical protein E3Q21_04355 [Wallemia mellicola]TIB83064.1 hypothetical protein E3Q20_04324 [Wallemia mellicola]TIC21866.1 hypothetical protein E3Q11_04306 [Wallemia mellicola]TIC36944.1 hypothetical protein E3Q07_04351 [Wallemia mellicola]
MSVEKKRKMSKVRVCDNCRRRKIKCDIEDMLLFGVDSCSRCRDTNSSCTFEEIAGKGTKYKDLYQSLHIKYDKFVDLFQKFHPGVDMETFSCDFSEESSSSYRSFIQETPIDLKTPSRALEIETAAVEAHINNGLYPHDKRILGDASAFKLKPVEQIRQLAFGSPGNFFLHRRAEFWSDLLWRDKDDGSFNPPESLISTLVDHYFSRTNLFRPLLHKQTFFAQWSIKAHDVDFQRLLWLVCAIGSRFYDDSRVLDKSDIDRDGNVTSWHSAGWPFFLKFLAIAKPMSGISPTLADLQQSVLAAVFLHSTPYHASSWTLAGRLAKSQALVLSADIGAHSGLVYSDELKNELRIRAFYNLFQIDVETSTFQGRDCISQQLVKIMRPSPLQDELGTPSESGLIFFNAFLSLLVITRDVLAKIYNEGTIRDAQNDQQKAARILDTFNQLNSRLDKWFMGLPSYLQWSGRKDDIYVFIQRSCLMGSYLMVQILLHRPFINACGELLSLSSISSAVCINCALSMAHVASEFKDVDPRTDTMVTNVFVICVAALTSKWVAKLKGGIIGAVVQVDNAIDELHNYLKLREKHYYVAGRLADIISYLKDTSESNNLDNLFTISNEELFNLDIDSLISSTVASLPM